jgi:hypothetical protein
MCLGQKNKAEIDAAAKFTPDRNDGSAKIRARWSAIYFAY